MGGFECGLMQDVFKGAKHANPHTHFTLVYSTAHSEPDYDFPNPNCTEIIVTSHEKDHVDALLSDDVSGVILLPGSIGIWVIAT
jgi:predicted Rossmann-fold nucleotide-binding protein